MQVIADLHIHSRFSRATSRDINIENLEKWARLKGISLLGTGDFSHPEWLKELKNKLIENEGILRTESGFPFVLSNEISLIYSKESEGRRVHLIILAPSFEIVDQINAYLEKKGRLDYDGRPIFNLSCVELTENLMSISKAIEIIPAHVWTPWFSIFGSMSGFDSMEEAFEDKVKYIHAFETGMSSDPAMNWRLSKLDKFSIVSFSDSHSYWPWRLGREATVFELKENFSYKDLVDAIRNKEIKFTVETSPSYGKYHYDGHRLCNFSCSPQEARKLNNICPICGKQLTIGVMHRVEELADRPPGFRPSDARPFTTLLPLHELIGAVFKVSMTSNKVWQEYNSLVKVFNNEFNILLDVPYEELRKITTPKIVHAIKVNREGKIKVRPGYDGQYGELILEGEKQEILF
ncbi:MAG: endonuclease Q family protein [Candidatus Pacearchaeota archaeon]